MIIKGTGRQAVLSVESWGLIGKWGGLEIVQEPEKAW